MIVLALFGFLPTIARKSLNYNKKGCAFAQPFLAINGVRKPGNSF